MEVLRAGHGVKGGGGGGRLVLAFGTWRGYLEREPDRSCGSWSWSWSWRAEGKVMGMGEGEGEKRGRGWIKDHCCIRRRKEIVFLRKRYLT